MIMNKKGQVTVDETIAVTGHVDRDANMLQLKVHVTVEFSLPPAIFSPGMRMIVEKELRNSVTRLIEAAKKVK